MMRIYHKLLLSISAISLVVAEIKEQSTKTEDTIIMWYPIPINLSAIPPELKETVDLSKSSGSLPSSLALYLQGLQNLQAAGGEPYANVDVNSNEKGKQGNCKQIPLKTKTGSYKSTWYLPFEEKLHHSSSNKTGNDEPMQYSAIPKIPLYVSSNRSDTYKPSPNLTVEQKSYYSSSNKTDHHLPSEENLYYSNSNETEGYKPIPYLTHENLYSGNMNKTDSSEPIRSPTSEEKLHHDTKNEANKYKIIRYKPTNETPIYSKTTNYPIYENGTAVSQRLESSEPLQQINKDLVANHEPNNGSNIQGSLKNPDAEDLSSNEDPDPGSSTSNNVVISFNQATSPTESSQNGSKIKVLTLKITVLNEDGASPLNKTKKENPKQVGKEKDATRLFNIVSTPSLDVTTESNVENGSPDEDIKHLENTEIIEETEIVTATLDNDSLSIQVSAKDGLNKTESNSKTHISTDDQMKTQEKSADDNTTILILSYKLINPKENKDRESNQELFNSTTEAALIGEEDLSTIKTSTEYLGQQNNAQNNKNTETNDGNKNSTENEDQNLQQTDKNLNKEPKLPKKGAFQNREETKEHTDKNDEQVEYTGENEQEIAENNKNKEDEYTSEYKEETREHTNKNIEQNSQDIKEKLNSENITVFVINKYSSQPSDADSNNSEDFVSALALRITPVTEANFVKRNSSTNGNEDSSESVGEKGNYLITEKTLFTKNLETDDVSNDHSKSGKPFEALHSNGLNEKVTASKNTFPYALINELAISSNDSEDSSLSQLKTSLHKLSLASNGPTCKCVYHLLQILLQDLIKPKLASTVVDIDLVETSTSPASNKLHSKESN